MKFIPIAGTKNKVFIEVDISDKTTESGIIIELASSEAEQTKGVVVAVSERDENGIPPNVQEGDTVYFPEHAPSPVEIEGTKYLVVKENMIYAKLAK